METRIDIQLLTLGGLGHRCAEETSRFFNRLPHDPAYCYELFRRAILHSNERAWEIIYEEYRPLVSGWVERHEWYQAMEEEAQFFVNGAFERMWRGISAQKFERFPDLKSLLRYLQLCVHSTIVDYARREKRNALNLTTSLEERSDVVEPAAETKISEKVEREELWLILTSKLNDEKEERVIYNVFVMGMKPREIFASFKSEFKGVKEIYRIKERVLNRLRRDNELLDLLP